MEAIDGGDVWYRCTPTMSLGESPIYRASDSTLHWVDCFSSPPTIHILRTDPFTGNAIGSTRILPVSDSVSVIYFRKNHPQSYICGYYQGIAFLDEETGEMEVVKEINGPETRDERRFNDGGVDPKGRFWLAEIDKRAMSYGAGKLPESYGRPKGRLFRYDGKDGSLRVMEDGIICGNGLAWSPDGKTMYFNDSVGQITWAYDFEMEKGDISNKRILIDQRGITNSENDGMVVDLDGNLWIAFWGSNKVMVYSTSGKLVKSIAFPASNVTCTTWGGKYHDILYLTSAHEKFGTTSTPGDQGGHMFRYKSEGLRGAPKYEFAG